MKIKQNYMFIIFNDEKVLKYSKKDEEEVKNSKGSYLSIKIKKIK